MNKLKITDGKLKRLERKFLKIVKREYPDGTTYYCEISRVDITHLDGNFIEFVVRYGEIGETEEVEMNKEVTFCAGDGNLTFLAGQFFQAIQTLENYGIDGNE